MWRNILTRIGIPAFANSTKASKDVAKLALAKAIKELSVGPSTTMSVPSNQALLKWNNTELATLSADQLEELGKAHLDGVNGSIDKNPSRALEMFKLSRDLGSKNASYSYAVCLRDGVGAEKDSTAAFELLKTLAEEDDQNNLAHFAVATLYYNGEGTPKDDVAALKHYQVAASVGHIPAFYNIGNFYSQGLGGVKQNDKKALLYYEAAVELQKEAADLGHPAAMFNIGCHYMSGDGVPQDMIKASEYFHNASAGGMSQAAVNLGCMYKDGAGKDFKKNLDKARESFAKFADIDNDCKELLEEVNNEIAAGTKT